MEQDIIEKLDDLYKQSTEERSHYYIGGVVIAAIFEIRDLRDKIDRIKSILK